MNKEQQRYIPCLRWKQGEYKALLNLSSDVRSMIVPLLDVAEIGFDFEKQEESKSVDEHLSLFVKRVIEKWGIGECFVDLHLIDESQRMADGKHPISFVFDGLRFKGVKAIPVMGINQDSNWLDAIQNAVDYDARGFCFRIGLEEAVRPNLGTLLDNLLQKYGRNVEQCDLIIDEKGPNFEPLDGFVGLLETIIKKLPHLNHWRTLALIGTSFPTSLSPIGSSTSIVPRYEWQAYKKLKVKLNSLGIRLPIFGDYTINRPEVSTVDQRFMRGRANIRYTIDNGWLIARGQKLRDMSESKGLCDTIVTSVFYRGQDFSLGDKYILECAQGIAKTGNPTTWRYVGTNHHLTSVARDVASLASF